MFLYSNLNPFVKSVMLGYGFFCNSKPCGMIFTGQLINLAFSPALKHR